MRIPSSGGGGGESAESTEAPCGVDVGGEAFVSAQVTGRLSSRRILEFQRLVQRMMIFCKKEM